MPTSRYRPPFWRRREPAPQHDIALLRPGSLLTGQRFETLNDVQIESERSEQLLNSFGSGGRKLARVLQKCREEHHRCDQIFCPICARVFRRWFTGELLRVAAEAHQPIRIFTVLLEQADRAKIHVLDSANYRHMLRKRLERAGLKNTSVIAGFEIAYKAKQKVWVLHINLVVIGGNEAALDRFKEGFDGSEIGRPIMSMPLKDRSEQLSYILKFGTYHRPLERTGPTKGPAKPLNAPEHHALVNWMAQRQFKDFLFLYNARRSRDSILVNVDGS